MDIAEYVMKDTDSPMGDATLVNKEDVQIAPLPLVSAFDARQVDTSRLRAMVGVCLVPAAFLIAKPAPTLLCVRLVTTCTSFLPIKKNARLQRLCILWLEGLWCSSFSVLLDAVRL